MPNIETTNPSTSTSTPGALPSPALDAVMPLLLAIAEEDILTLRLDPQQAVLTAVGSTSSVLVHEPALVACFGAERAQAIHRTVPLARAFEAADARFVAGAGVDLEPLAAEVAAARAGLVLAAEALIQRKALPKKALAKLIGGNAYPDRITDVRVLVALLRGRWADVAPHTKLTAAELDAAQALADAFSVALGEREQAAERESEAARLRARAWTAFFRNWETVRKMVHYLRWHQGDADAIAPSLYAGRRRARTEVPSQPESPSTPIAPGMPGAPPFAPL